MASLNEIEEFLNVETGDKKLCDGKRRKNKNQYYYFRDEFYLVKLTQDKWMIAPDCKRTRRLLRLYSWCFHPYGYATTPTSQSERMTIEYIDNRGVRIL